MFVVGQAFQSAFSTPASPESLLPGTLLPQVSEVWVCDFQRSRLIRNPIAQLDLGRVWCVTAALESEHGTQAGYSGVCQVGAADLRVHASPLDMINSALADRGVNYKVNSSAILLIAQPRNSSNPNLLSRTTNRTLRMSPNRERMARRSCTRTARPKTWMSIRRQTIWRWCQAPPNQTLLRISRPNKPRA